MMKTKTARPTQSAPLAAGGESEHVAAGPFSEWLHATHRARKLSVLGAAVPCGTCTGCCQASMFIHIAPHETRALARIPRRLLFPAPGLPKGHWLMGYDANGRCPMLVDRRCSIYEDRPQTCRDFDCRVFAASGINPDQRGPNTELTDRVRAWRFDHPSDADSTEHAAVREAGRFLSEHRDAFPEAALPNNPVQLALLAVRLYELFLGLNDAADKKRALPTPAEIARAVLGELDVSAPRSESPPSRATEGKNRGRRARSKQG